MQSFSNTCGDVELSTFFGHIAYIQFQHTRDWAVAGWMVFVVVTAIWVGISTNCQLRLLKFSILSKEDLKQKWKEFDEECAMSRNEIAAAFIALDRNFDEKIAFEEFYMWWQDVGAVVCRCKSCLYQ
jgi:hypothetical protein